MNAGAIHPRAAQGFGAAAAEYERGRPGYPVSALDFVATALGIGLGSVVIDLAAGTGKLTRSLPHTARVIAIEPVGAMRAELTRVVPDVEVVGGVAEALPLRSDIADAVLVGNAWHWFDAERALAEVHRVLRRGGGLALIHNRRDETYDWVAEMSRIIDRRRGETPGFRFGDWKKSFSRTELFGPLQEAAFSNEQPMSISLLKDRVTSISFIAALPEAERNATLNEVIALIRRDIERPDSFVMPHKTEVLWTVSR
jgi:SAM-dependent methyltransferase